MKKKYQKVTTLRLEEQDIKAILQIRAYYGLLSDSQAIITALRLQAKQLEKGEGGHSPVT